MVQRLQNRTPELSQLSMDRVEDPVISWYRYSKEIAWGTVEERLKYFTAMLLYRCLSEEMPFCLGGGFYPRNSILF